MFPEFDKMHQNMTYSTDEAVWSKAIKDLQQYTFDEILYIPYLEMAGAFGYRTDRFTEQQLKDFVIFVNMYQLDGLGRATAWE
jgi:ABC-type oligopeptide transport system substrate-binding subunit